MSERKMLVTNKYIKNNVTKEWLDAHNFRYQKILSCDEETAYTYRFPVYRFGAFTILECEICIILETGKVKLNVFDNGTRNMYAPFYYDEYGRNSVVQKINEKIESNLQKLKIKQVQDKDYATD